MNLDGSGATDGVFGEVNSPLSQRPIKGTLAFL